MLASPLISSSEKWGLYPHRVSVRVFEIIFMKGYYSILFTDGFKKCSFFPFPLTLVPWGDPNSLDKRTLDYWKFKTPFPIMTLLLPVQYFTCLMMLSTSTPFSTSLSIHLKPVCPPECLMSAAIIISPLLSLKKQKSQSYPCIRTFFPIFPNISLT